MPLLKDLTCSIELSDSQQALQEFGTVYGDGIVETFISVLKRPQAFSIHLTSTQFIAPGLSIFVFIDGVYQCNRNRQGLELRDRSENQSLVDFRVRQKEEKQKDGSMIARQWTFENLDIISADKASDLCSPSILEKIGCIEVVVLRCAGFRESKKATQINLDGASDHYDYQSGLNNPPRRLNRNSGHNNREPLTDSFGINYGPPLPVPFYRTPFVEPFHNNDSTVSDEGSAYFRTRPLPATFSNHHSRPHSRYSEPVSPGGRPRSHIPYPGFQYGSGPVPSIPAPYIQQPLGSGPTNTPGIDHQWLGALVQKAVKQGVEESRGIKSPLTVHSENNDQVPEVHSTVQPPGAWPMSPFATAAQQTEMPNTHNISANIGGQDTFPGQSKNEPTKLETTARKESYVTWNEDPVWEGEANAEGWMSPKKTPDDAWDSDETWASETHSEIGVGKQKRRFRASSTDMRSNLQPRSHPTSHTHERRLSNAKPRRTGSTSRDQNSIWEDKLRSSSEDDDGWTHVKATPDSFNSRDTFDSGTSMPRGRAREQHHPSTFTHNGKEEIFPSHDHHQTSAYQPAPIFVDSTPSVVTRITPRIMNGPPSNAPVFAPRMYSRRLSVHTNSAAPVFSSPDWGWTVPTKAKNVGHTSIPIPPAPYTTNLNGFMQSKRAEKGFHSCSTYSSTWGGDAKQKTDWKEGYEGGWEDGHANEWNAIKSYTAQQNSNERKWNDEHNVQWGPKNTYTISPAPETPAKAGSNSKLHTGKSLSRYRQLRQNSSNQVPIPHWQLPTYPSTKPVHPNANEPDGSKMVNVTPTKTLHTASKEISDQKGVEHQVMAGKSMRYGHAVGRPKYLDELDKPYAVFRFKYRSRTKLKTIFGDHIPDHGHLTVPTPQSTMAKKKEQLKELPQNELIEKMLKLQTRLAEQKQARKDSSAYVQHNYREKDRRQSNSQQAEKVARDLTEEWVKQHSRDPSKQSMSDSHAKASNVRKEKTEETPVWEQIGWRDGDKNNTTW